MTRTEELLALAEAAIGDYVPVAGVSLEMLAFQWKVTPETVKQLVELARLQNAALSNLFDNYKRLADSGDAGFWSLEDTEDGSAAIEAIAAFNKFEQGGK